MGSENSTDSVSCASMAYRLRAGLRTIARAVYSAAMRVARRPIPRIETEKKEKFVIATERDSFVWNVTRGRKGSSNEDLPPMFVRVEPDPVIEQSEKQEWPDKPMAKKVYNTPSYSTITPTSSGAVMFEFSSSRFDMDMLNLEESDETEVYEAPVFKDFYESEEERQEFESIYEDLTVDAVLEYMDTIDIYGFDYESLYEDLTVDAVLEYMDTIDLYHADKAFVPDYVISEIESPEECETTITVEPRFVPDYVISEIASAEMCETTIEVEQPAAEVPVEMPAEQIDVATKSIMAQFIFGFDAPAKASAGPTKFRFIAGTEEEPEEDIEDIQIMTYSGDAAVSAQSFSNGPLAL